MRIARQRKAPPVSSALNLHSPLYDRFNGFALGAFFAACTLEFAARRYGIMRRRLEEFLAEIGLPTRLPLRHDAFRQQHNELLGTLRREVRTRSPALEDFMVVGIMAVFYAASAPLATRQKMRALRERWVPTLERFQVGPEVFDQFVARIRRRSATREAGTLLSNSFNLVTALIEPLEVETDTCFVAMPFRRPFAGCFSTYYRPALARAGFRAIRAWGGISSEEYYPFVGTLISRSGAVLAELGSLNLNVINEIGFAHGANRPTFLIMPKQRRDPPSNIAQLPILQYTEGGAGWPALDVPRLTRFIRWMWGHYQATEARA